MNIIELPAGPGDAGVITSPFYPNLLPRQCSCTWKFQVQVVKSTVLAFYNVGVDVIPNIYTMTHAVL